MPVAAAHGGTRTNYGRQKSSEHRYPIAKNAKKPAISAGFFDLADDSDPRANYPRTNYGRHISGLLD
jgi:hypothetical protein